MCCSRYRFKSGNHVTPLHCYSYLNVWTQVALYVFLFSNQRTNVMAVGSVKWFNPTKGFGFIEPEDGGADAFVHISAVEQAGLSGLQEGQKVDYDLETGRNGKSSATNLKVVG